MFLEIVDYSEVRQRLWVFGCHLRPSNPRNTFWARRTKDLPPFPAVPGQLAAVVSLGASNSTELFSGIVSCRFLLEPQSQQSHKQGNMTPLQLVLSVVFMGRDAGLQL